MAQYLTTFTKQISDDINLFGFKIFDSKQASLYMHCIDLLSQDYFTFDGGIEEIQYSIDDFESIKISSAEMKTLCKIFELDYLNESSSIGIFPDAINDAYENGLIDDEENVEDQDYIDDY